MPISSGAKLIPRIRMRILVKASTFSGQKLPDYCARNAAPFARTDDFLCRRRELWTRGFLAAGSLSNQLLIQLLPLRNHLIPGISRGQKLVRSASALVSFL